MMKDNKISAIAIIPARGGSKRLPGKNTLSFCGHPIIKYTIDAAVATGIFDEIMVSTDDSEIAALSKKFGAKVPFMRSAKSSSDKANIPEVITEVIKSYEKLNIKFEYLCCLLATAPLMDPKKIAEGFVLIQKDDIQSVMAVTDFGYPIQRSLKIEKDKLTMVNLRYKNSRSQDLEPRYHDAAQFYWVKTSAFKKYKSFLLPATRSILLSGAQVQDIDDMDDFKIAELKYRLKND